MEKRITLSGLSKFLDIIKSKFATKTELSTKQNTLTFDSEPVEGSTNPVTSDGVYQCIQHLPNILVEDEEQTLIPVSFSSAVIGGTAPSNPADGDVWIETEE